MTIEKLERIANSEPGDHGRGWGLAVRWVAHRRDYEYWQRGAHGQMDRISRDDAVAILATAA